MASAYSQRAEVLERFKRIEKLPRSPAEHSNAACFLALILGAVRSGSLPEAERDALARSLAERAMAELILAVEQE